MYYAYIKGTVAQRNPDSMVVEAGGIGYLIYVSPRTLQSMPQMGQLATVYTYLSVREDAMLLYGFATQEEKAMFEKLIAVSGVGPKLAVAILAGMRVAELSLAIASSDARAIARVPGVGKKTAERLILELKEKIGQLELQDSEQGDVVLPLASKNAQKEAVEALLGLGYSSMEATRAVAACPDTDNVEVLIMTALKSMDRR